LTEHGWTESKLERCVFTYVNERGELVGVLFVHVDDLLLARRTAGAEPAGGTPDGEFDTMWGKLATKLHLGRRDGQSWQYCGKTIVVTPAAFLVSTPGVLEALEPVPLAHDRKKADDSALTAEELQGYRSTLGVLLFAATWTRPDLACRTSLAAQRTVKAPVADAKELNRVVTEARLTKAQHIVVRRGVVIRSCSVVVWGDSAFANADGEKSQYGVVACLTENPEGLITASRFDQAVHLLRIPEHPLYGLPMLHQKNEQVPYSSLQYSLSRQSQ
jgi:hypothetical protein